MGLGHLFRKKPGAEFITSGKEEERWLQKILSGGHDEETQQRIITLGQKAETHTNTVTNRIFNIIRMSMANHLAIKSLDDERVRRSYLHNLELAQEDLENVRAGLDAELHKIDQNMNSLQGYQGSVLEPLLTAYASYFENLQGLIRRIDLMLSNLDNYIKLTHHRWPGARDNIQKVTAISEFLTKLTDMMYTKFKGLPHTDHNTKECRLAIKGLKAA